MRQVVLGGPELHGLTIDTPAASVRLLLPVPGERRLVMPTWTGNQFELPDGQRAPIRTFTPLDLDTERQQLTLDIVVHGRGAASQWVQSTAVGDEVAISGPGRGDAVDPDASSYLLAGDETAIAAIGQLLDALPPSTQVQVHIEVTHPSARLELPTHPNAAVTWCESSPDSPPGDTIVAAVESLAEVPDRVWVAGEAAAVQRIRTHLFDDRGIPRSRVTARGYWKHGRSAT